MAIRVVRDDDVTPAHVGRQPSHHDEGVPEMRDPAAGHPAGIRPAALSDAAAIARLCHELGYPAAPEGIAPRLAELLASPHALVAVATGEDGTLTGWIAVERRLTLESGESAEITGLVVAAAARRQGIGAALVAAAERWVAERGLTAVRVRSNVVRPESHAFYQRLGYARRKTQHVYEKPLEVERRPFLI